MQTSVLAVAPGLLVKGFQSVD